MPAWSRALDVPSYVAVMSEKALRYFEGNRPCHRWTSSSGSCLASQSPTRITLDSNTVNSGSLVPEPWPRPCCIPRLAYIRISRLFNNLASSPRDVASSRTGWGISSLAQEWQVCAPTHSLKDLLSLLFCVKAVSVPCQTVIFDDLVTPTGCTGRPCSPCHLQCIC